MGIKAKTFLKLRVGAGGEAQSGCLKVPKISHQIEP